MDPIDIIKKEVAKISKICSKNNIAVFILAAKGPGEFWTATNAEGEIVNALDNMLAQYIDEKRSDMEISPLHTKLIPSEN